MNDAMTSSFFKKMTVQPEGFESTASAVNADRRQLPASIDAAGLKSKTLFKLQIKQ
jgi:hypothetical protein